MEPSEGFVTDYLDKDGHQIAITRQLSVNGNIQFLRLSDQSWGSGLTYISILLDQVEATGRGSSNNSNQIWGGNFNNTNVIINATWGDSIDAIPTNLPKSSRHPRTSDTASVMIYFVAGVRRVCGVNLISAIPRFVDGGKPVMVR